MSDELAKILDSAMQGWSKQFDFAATLTSETHADIQAAWAAGVRPIPIQSDKIIDAMVAEESQFQILYSQDGRIKLPYRSWSSSENRRELPYFGSIPEMLTEMLRKHHYDRDKAVPRYWEWLAVSSLKLAAWYHDGYLIVHLHATAAVRNRRSPPL